MFLLLINFYKD